MFDLILQYLTSRYNYKETKYSGSFFNIDNHMKSTFLIESMITLIIYSNLYCSRKRLSYNSMPTC